MQSAHIKNVADYRPKVLLLDDDQAALEEIQEILELEDLQSIPVATIDDALCWLDMFASITVIVTDVHLHEDRSGLDFVAQARDRFPHRVLSFIMVSGDAGAVTASIETGVIDFLTKPLMPESLVAAIHEASRPDDQEGADLSATLMRKVEATTKSMQQMSVDLALKERTISESKETYDRHRIHGAKLRKGLSDGHIVPWFQPQICLQTGAVLGFEALVRWIDPALGSRTPAEFLPLASEIGLMLDIDLNVQRQAFNALAYFHGNGVASCDIGINLTAGQLRNPDLVDYFCLELERTGLTPGVVSIEILESAMLDDEAADPIKNNINRLAALGFRIDLDDFGTGHAGLSSLRDLDVSRVKIDRSFVRDVHVDTKLQKFTRALIGLAKTLNIEVLAEGIESPDEIDWLRAEGCDAVQGYIIAKPMPADDALRWAVSRQAGLERLTHSLFA